MAEDLEITGATAGSPRYIVAYLDVNTNNLYDANGNLYGNSTLATTLGNEFILELHYVQDISTSDNPDNWTPWEGLNGMTVSSTLAFDDNYVHAVEATVAENTVAGSTKVKINVPEINKDVLSSSGTLVFNPFGIEPEDAQQNETRPVKQIVSYNAFEYISGTVFEFTIEDAQGLPIDVVGGENATPVRVSDPLYLFVGTDAIYENNIPDRYGEGVFKFPMNINSRKLLKALDYSGASGVSGTMEHNIYVERNTLANIVISGSTFSRNSDGDAVAKDLSDDNTYVFCDWTSGSTSYWTRGKDITSGTPLYTVSGGTATQTGDTATPVYNTDSVLFRTFAFPFIVKNLVDYGNSITIPVENTDWTKDYIISIIRNNMEIVIGKASTATYGTVMVGGSTANIDIDDGVISVKDASTSAKGVVQLVDSTSDTTSTDKAVTPNYVKVIADTKQDNLTFDTTTGIEVISGTTVKNDIATVEEVLTGATGTNIVDADNLKGALSVGQAVDVSCEPVGTGGATLTGNFIDTMTLTRTNAIYGNGWACIFSSFPKFSSGLRYLLIADVKLITDTSLTYNYYNVNRISSETDFILTKNNIRRIAGIFTQQTSVGFVFYATAETSTTYTVEFTNFRVYEVTALTDEAIAYIAQLEDPDAFFRSTSAYSIRDKYLIKQDMVCPFIPTINMPDNSDLTVAAGLSYKIKYTNDNPHTITADTIPSDAYGWDTHIQMFIKGTSAINFQAPLVLMDALTPNAGHNMVVKWRNGDALVYVDDTNAGYIVVKASGTGTGTLNDAISNDYTDYVIFSGDLAGTVIDAGDATFAGGTGFTAVNILGNGTEDTVITGNISATSGKTINLQSLTIDGGTLGGAGTMNLDDVTLSDDIDIISTTIYCNDVNILNGSTVSNLQTSSNNFHVYSLNLNGTLDIQKAIDLKGNIFSSNSTGLVTGQNGNNTAISADSNTSINNICITGAAYGVNIPTNKINVNINGCTITENNGDGQFAIQAGIYCADKTSVTISNSYISGNNSPSKYDITARSGSTVRINNSTIGNLFAYDDPAHYSTGLIRLIFSGTITSTTTKTSVISSSWGPRYDVYLEDGTHWIFNTAVGLIVLTNTTSHPEALDRLYIGDNVTITTSSNVECLIDGCICNSFGATGIVCNHKLPNSPDIIINSNRSIWRATSITLSSPLDASSVDTIRLSGTTFTSVANSVPPLVKNANRIQLPASTTVSFQGNTNPANTKILDASLIVVGDNPASPSGSATVVNASGTSSTVTGIGTYIDKEGDNDFVANNTTNVVAVDGSTTGAKYLGTVLSATTGETGANRFAKIDSGVVAVVNEATNAVNKQIITHDYEPIIGGTFSLTSATVNEATKTVAIQSGGTMSIVDIRGGKDSVIDLGGTSINGSGSLLRPTASGVTITGGSTATYGGVMNVNGGAQASFSGCIFRGNTAAGRGGALYAANSPTKITLENCLFYDNVASMGKDIDICNSAIVSIAGCTIGDIHMVNRPNLQLREINHLGLVEGDNGTVTISSGAILDLTGNSNATPIAPGGGIVFEQGGATVLYSSGAVSGSYMMDNVTLPTGAKLTNMAVVDLGGAVLSNTSGTIVGANLSNGQLRLISGGVASNFALNNAQCYTFSGGAADTVEVNGGGYLFISEGGIVNNVTNNSGGVLTVWRSTITSNNIVKSGGIAVVSSAGTSIEPIISSGGSLSVKSGGSALLVTSNTGASVTVAEGGYITYKDA